MVEKFERVEGPSMVRSKWTSLQVCGTLYGDGGWVSRPGPGWSLYGENKGTRAVPELGGGGFLRGL